jgi:hypothetical protein
MTGPDTRTAAPLTVTAALIIRSTPEEIRLPASARQQWTRLRNPRALATGVTAGPVTVLIDRPHDGAAVTARAVLAGTLTACLADPAAPRRPG